MNISVLGSTGSIGTQTLDIVRNNPDMHVTALTSHTNTKLMEEQIREFRPRLACVYEKEHADMLRIAVSDTNTRVVSGMEGLIMAASDSSAQIVVTAVVGMIGIRPTIEAIKTGHTIALANKETLVTAGHIIMELARQHKVKILPVDSEHSAIFQALESRGASPDGSDVIERIILTASGGPFRGKSREELEHVKAADALRHPNWTMGHKVTIDSATLANKGLELMEACHLFNVTNDRVQIVIQPQSILHSAVEFIDGSIIGQMSTPDMRLPIQYALTYPERRVFKNDRVDFFRLGSMTFEKPDMETFRALRLAYKVCERGNNLPTVFNAADEFAVDAFLKGRVSFNCISEMIEAAVENVPEIVNPTLEEVLYTERETYNYLHDKFGI